MKHVYRQRLRKSVVVTLDNEETFRGVLFDMDRDAIVLRSASQLNPTIDSERQFIPADGEIVIPASRVAYFQFT